jgi:hypothetical protein
MTDDAALFSKQFPVVAVAAAVEEVATDVFWDPATYPDGFTTIDDLKEFARPATRST